MILACVTSFVVLFCGQQYNYAHALVSGKQKAIESGVYLVPTDSSAGFEARYFSDSSFDVPAEYRECSCPIPPEAKPTK